MMDTDRAGLHVLSREASRELLSTAGVGRIVFHARAMPRVLPVCFALDGDSVVFRTLPEGELRTAVPDAVVAFEVDAVTAEGTCWSVTATGVARVVDDPAEVAHLRALGLPGWAGSTGEFIRIPLDTLSGRVGQMPAPPVRAGHGPPGPAGRAAVAETHVGVVVFVGDRAYKLKKPVDLGFVDFRTREARLEACRREVELNSRLAPDVYLGVADVTGPDGRVCDHLVVMRRMPAERRLSTLVRADDPDLGRRVDGIARKLVGFHGRSARSAAADEAGGRDAQAARWRANAGEMARFVGSVLDPSTMADVDAWSDRYLAGRGPVFEQRVAQGRVCDGHGDLLADDIFCLDDGARILDCLEFDDALRYGDVLADLAFLAMDFERLGRADLGARLLDRYAHISGDRWPRSLAHHYVAYRAQVRAKVACLRWAQGDAPSRVDADRLLGLCHRHLARGRVLLVLVGGAPGTGKSTLAGNLAGALGATVVRSDEVRKELMGVPPDEHRPAGLDEALYDPAVTEATYAELTERARQGVRLGESVVLDASWRPAAWREAAQRLAEETSADLTELRCEVPVAVAAARVGERLAAGTDPSDATPELAAALAGLQGEWPTATAVSTEGRPEESLARARAAVEGDEAVPDRVAPSPAAQGAR